MNANRCFSSPPQSGGNLGRRGRFSNTASREWQLVIVFAALLVLRCTSPQAIANARYNGAMAGREAGLRAGTADGFAATFPSARVEAYETTLGDLYATGNFNRKPFYTIAALGGGFLAGLLFQYILLYLLRRAGFADVDRIVLPSRMMPANLARPSASKRRKPRCNNLWLLFLILMPLLAVSCNEEEQAWKEAYDASYTISYQEGREAGAARGLSEGSAAGQAAAQTAARLGTAWELYVWLIVGSFLVGVLSGLTLQYFILFQARGSHSLIPLHADVLVPAVRHSLAYSIHADRVRLELEKQRALRRLHVKKTVRMAELDAAHDQIRRRVLAVDSIDALTKGRFVELAEKEFSRIIAEAEGIANQRATRD